MTARYLHVSDRMNLPPDTVTSSIVVYGGKGMGKTNFAGVLCEEVAASSLRFSLIDPMGVSWGLRHDASGKGKGIELLILGGIHGDIPIEPTGGEVVADLVADEDVSVLIDISRHPNGTMWSKSERVRFVTAYCRRLYMRQGEKRRPLLQMIDEAARFAPQTIRQGDTDAAACVGAVADLVEEGRNVGVGVALFTQRSARLSKDVAELADMMVAFRTVGPNSMKAVLDWLGEYVEKERHKEIALALRKLAKGAALIVSPGWLEIEEIVQMRLRHTFDSSATPKPGQAAARVSGPGAKPDLGRYLERMKETIQRAALDDPKTLRAEIKRLTAELAKKPTAAPAKAAPAPKPPKTVTKYVPDGRLVSALDAALRQSAEKKQKSEEAEGKLWLAVKEVRDQLQRLPSTSWSAAPTPPAKAASPEETKAPAAAEGRVSTQRTADAPKLGSGEGRLLAALDAAGANGLSRVELAIRAIYHHAAGGFRNTLSSLRVGGLVEDARSENVTITPAGRAARAALAVEAFTAEEIVAAWRKKISGGACRIFDVLLSGGTFTRDDLAVRSKFDAAGGGFRNCLSELRVAGLIVESKAGVEVSPIVRGAA